MPESGAKISGLMQFRFSFDINDATSLFKPLSEVLASGNRVVHMQTCLPAMSVNGLTSPIDTRTIF